MCVCVHEEELSEPVFMLEWIVQHTQLNKLNRYIYITLFYTSLALPIHILVLLIHHQHKLLRV